MAERPEYISTDLGRDSHREAWLLVISQGLVAWPIGFLMVVLPIYLKKAGIDPVWIGSFYTISGIFASLFLLVLGPILDRKKKKPFLLLGTALPLLSFLMLAFSRNPWAIIISSALGGIGLSSGIAGAFQGATFSPLLMLKAGVKGSTKFFSYMTSAWLLSATVGSLLGGLPDYFQGWGLSFDYAYRLSFFLCALFTLLAALFLLPIREDEAHLSPERTRLFSLKGEGQKFIWKYGITQAFIGLGAGFVVQLLSLWFFLKFGVGEVQIAPWFAAANFAAMIGAYLVPGIVDRRGKLVTVISTQLLSALFVVLIIVTGNYQLAAFFFLMRTVLINMSWPAQNAFLMSVVPEELRSSAAAVSNASFGFSSALSPLLGGWLMQTGHIDLPIALGAFCFFLSGSFFWLLFKRKGVQEG
ncbi:MAG: MFS transporter [bacterium]|jgi:MFS family permease